MLNNWFNKSDDNQAHPLKQYTDGPSHVSSVDLVHPSADLVDEESAQRATTTTLSTPHDAVLAELHGGKLGIDTHTKETLVAEGSPPGQTRSNNPYPTAPAFLPSLSPTSEALYDPFTGAHIGDLLTDEQDPSANTEQELWTHLSKILKLQSDIADMHVQMEGIGLKKPGPAPKQSKTGSVNRRPSTSGGREWGSGIADEGVDEEADEEAENKRKREEEFSRLNDKFTGRRDAIDGIMKNVQFILT
jgi:hypothetical protein